MSNEAERNKFKADYTRKFDTCPRGYIVETGEYTNDHAAGCWWSFQAGAAYQRQQKVVMPEWLSSIEAFTDRLYEAGWRANADAQWSGAIEMFRELNGGKP